VEDYTKSGFGDRLSIIPEGVSEEFFRAGNRRACGTPSAKTVLPHHSIPPLLHHSLPPDVPYFLWAGSLNPRKNLPRVVEAFEKITEAIPHHLVLSGGLGWDSHEALRRIQNSPAHRRIHLLGHVGDDELRSLYQGATAFVYVSLMEGFGLPILEAMACGCPVITSNLSSMPEVAGDAAFLVDPLDTDDIGAAMHCLATDLTFAKHLSNRGRARAEEFHWEACAWAVAKVYRQVATKPASVRRPIVAAPSAELVTTGVAEAEEDVCAEGVSLKSSS